MPWVRIDEDFPQHPKLIQAGPLALAMQVAGLCYCNRYLTDGFVPRSAAASLLHFEGLTRRRADLQEEEAGWESVVADLVRSGAWLEVPGGWRIHDYLSYQPSRSEVLDERRRRQEAGRKGGQAAAKARAQADAKASPKAAAKAGPKGGPQGVGVAEAQAKSKPGSVPVPITTPSPNGDGARTGHPAITAFFDEAELLGWGDAAALWRGKIAGAVARAAKAGIESELIVDAAREVARRRDLSAWPNILADLQKGEKPGRRPAPKAPAEPASWRAIRALSAGESA